jgi:hypothetical protein
MLGAQPLQGTMRTCDGSVPVFYVDSLCCDEVCCVVWTCIAAPCNLRSVLRCRGAIPASFTACLFCAVMCCDIRAHGACVSRGAYVVRCTCSAHVMHVHWRHGAVGVHAHMGAGVSGQRFLLRPTWFISERIGVSVSEQPARLDAAG